VAESAGIRIRRVFPARLKQVGCSLSEEELWSGIDRNAPEVKEHLATCERCRALAEQFRAGIAFFSSGSVEVMDRPLPQRVGPYTIKRLLGQGGMGIVYEGRQRSPDRSVAVKVVRGGEHVDDLRIRLFQSESQTQGRLSHPGIAAIYEAGRTDDGQYFFAMELVDGLPLGEYLEQERPSLRRRLELFCRICEPVIYAHQHGVIHRDLKPSNILIDSQENPKILDFGLARITDPEGTLASTAAAVGQLMGTLPYMSPEEARGDPANDVRSDVYSLGVILYEMFTGELPYSVSRSDLPGAVRAICEEQPRRPSLLNRALRGDLETITLKALQKESGLRYQSVRELTEDIERHLGDEPIRARPPSLPYQLRKLLIRRKITFVFLACILIVVAGARSWIIHAEIMMRGAQQALETTRSLESGTQARNLAELYHQHGDFEEAKSAYETALAKFRSAQREDSRYAAQVQTRLAVLLIEQDDPTAADRTARLLAGSRSVYERLESPDYERKLATVRGLDTLSAAKVLQHRGLFPDARTGYREALAIFESGDDLHARYYAAHAMLGLGSTLIEQGDPAAVPEAQSWFARARSIYQDAPLARFATQFEIIEALQLIGAAEVSRAQGQLAKAASDYRRAIEVLDATFGEPTLDAHGDPTLASHRLTAHTMLRLGLALMDPKWRGPQETKEHGDVESRNVEAEGLFIDVVAFCEENLQPGHDLHIAALEAQLVLYGPEAMDDSEMRDYTASALEEIRDSAH